MSFSWIRALGSTLDPMFAQLSDVNGPLDLPSGTTVVMVGTPILQPHAVTPGQVVSPIVPVGGGAAVERPGATTDDPNRGYVRYDLTPTDVAVAAIYDVKWMVLPPGQSNPQAFPEDTSMYLWVRGNP